MNEEKDNFFSERGAEELISRFENVLNHSRGFYFDIVEFEEIIDHYLGLGNIDLASRAVEYALLQHPSSTVMQLKNALVHIERAQPQESLDIISNVEKIESNNPEVKMAKGLALTRLGKIHDALKEFNRAIQLTTDGKTDLMFNIAVALEQQNYFQTALEYLLKAHKLEPDNLSVIYDIAFCYERSDQLKKALAFYNKFLDIDPFSENVWYNMGVIYNRLENYSRAIEAYDFAIALDEGFSSAFFNKANTLANTGKYDHAIEVYNELLYLEENNVQVICYIGECYEKLDKPDEALDQYERVLDIDPEYSDAWLGKGLVMYSKGAYIQSRLYVEKALRLQPENPEYWYSLGNIHLKLNEQGEAIKAFRKAVDLDPQDSDSWINMAETYMALKNKIGAISTLVEAIGKNPGHALFTYRLAAYHLINKDMEKADHYLRIALSLDYDLHKDFYAYYPRAARYNAIKKLVDTFDSNR
jgi:tetratricopeptide (TPR) repeat protein